MDLVSGRSAAVTLAAVAALVFAGSPPVHAQTPSDDDIRYSDGRPRNARLTIPKLPRIHELRVVVYYGKTDDAEGTRIQNRGIAASSHGRNGGTGPGGIGNYQVAAHRTSHGGIFSRTPTLDRGDRVFVDVGRWRYVYRVIKTRWVSFRSAKSLRAQRAEVPGKPRKTATRGYLTLSTCATPEDRARGNFWTDRFGNPEHRIDKIGLLQRRVLRPGAEPPGSR